MARAAAVFLIGALLLIVIVFVVSRVSDRLKMKGSAIWKVVILIAVAGLAFWYFGNGMVFEYFNK